MEDNCIIEEHAKFGACYMCCETCNVDRHICHFCGASLTHNSYEDRAMTRRHWLSDCRPDLIDGTYDGGETVYPDGPMV